MKGLAENPGAWVKSTYSGQGSNSCVEAVLARGGRIGVRDSVHRRGHRLDLPPAAWVGFLGGLRPPRA
ncbi:protein of unknown function [Nocardiopsis flavescens]|uniref:DUF397 domain-containing protein n=1 Tax=Nocardiopsis flavescens TaxID=758803 RepID=A0A1M6M6F9_9ACTN|nr:protein of unknown function [Nocardiopsis flavescens]